MRLIIRMNFEKIVSNNDEAENKWGEGIGPVFS